MKHLKIIGWTLAGGAAVAAYVLVLGAVVMLLWNWLMPALFGLSVLTLWQAVGVAVAAKLAGWLLFGRRAHHHSMGCGWHRKFHEHAGKYHCRSQGIPPTAS